MRLRNQQYSIAVRKFAELLRRYHTVQSKFEQQARERIERQLTMSGENLSREQVCPTHSAAPSTQSR